MMRWSIKQVSVSAFLLACICGGAVAQQPAELRRPQRGQDQSVPSSEETKPAEEPSRQVSPEHKKELIAEFVRVFPSFNPSALLQSQDEDDALRKLRKDRCHYAIEECLARFLEYKSGRSSVTPVLAASSRVSDSLLSLEPDASVKKEILDQQLTLAKEVERLSALLYHNGMGTLQELSLAKYARVTAEIELLKLKAASK